MYFVYDKGFAIIRPLQPSHENFPSFLFAATATVCGTPVVSRLSVYYRDIVAEETSAVYRFSPRYTPNKITQHFTQSAHSYHGSIGPDVDPHLNNQLRDFWISGEFFEPHCSNT